MGGIFLGFLLLAWFAVVLSLISSQLATRRSALEAFARALAGGRVTGEWWGAFTVQGLYAGRRRRLELPGNRAAMAVEVRDPAVELVLTRAGVMDQLQRFLGLVATPQAGLPGGLVVRGQEEATRRCQRDDARQAIEALFALPGVERLALGGGWLRVERAHHSRGSTEQLDLATRLSRLAGLLDRRELQLVVRGAERAFVWTAGGEEARCPYCRDALALEGQDVEACPACGTAHHAACLAEAGGCTVFACRGGPERLRARG